MAEVLRDRAEQRGERPRLGPRPASIAVQETLAELRKHRRAEPMVDLMDRPIPTAEEEAEAADEDKVVPISIAQPERPSTPRPEPDEAPDALQA